MPEKIYLMQLQSSWWFRGVSYDTLNNVFKIIGNFYQYLKNKDSIRKSFPKYLFKQLGDLKFLLKYNYSIEKNTG